MQRKRISPNERRTSFIKIKECWLKVINFKIVKQNILRQSLNGTSSRRKLKNEKSKREGQLIIFVARAVII